MSAPALVSLAGVSVVFGTGVRALSDVSLDLAEGETLALVGESGSGKTTLARAVLGLVRPTSGHVLFDGKDVAAMSGTALHAFRRAAQMVFQDPMASLSPRMRIGSLLAEPLDIHGISRADGWSDVLALVRRVGLPPTVLEKYPHQISGGQARRVGIARALVLKPWLVVADEPTAGLDVSVQGDIINLMNELQVGFRLTYLVVSHNLAVVRAMSHRIAVMYLGRIVETGPTDEVLARPAHHYTRALINAAPALELGTRPRREVLPGEIPSPLAPPSGCAFHTRCPRADDKCRAVVPPLAAMGPGRAAACHWPLATA
jgi:oligopeptide transport system ATP-binding protein